MWMFEATITILENITKSSCPKQKPDCKQRTAPAVWRTGHLWGGAPVTSSPACWAADRGSSHTLSTSRGMRIIRVRAVTENPLTATLLATWSWWRSWRSAWRGCTRAGEWGSVVTNIRIRIFSFSCVYVQMLFVCLFLCLSVIKLKYAS